MIWLQPEDFRPQKDLYNQEPEEEELDPFLKQKEKEVSELRF